MVAIKPPKQIKTPSNLKIAMRYILNEAKTLVEDVKETDTDFPLIYHNGEMQLKLVSGYGIEDVSVADEEMVMTKIAAAFKKGDDDLKELNSGKQVLAHHLIQSFSPEDNLTPEQVHEIGRQTMMEFTGGDYEFVIATHVDKHHLHNHIILSTTNTSTLKKMRWQKNTLKNLRVISDKHAAKYGAKIIEPSMKNSYTKYSAWRRQNNYRFEIKQRLDFLLKHSTSLEDFKQKATPLDLQIDFSGKFVKYQLTDQPQKRRVRDDTLSKKGRYSLEQIKEQVEKNQLVYDVSEIKERYQETKSEIDNDFELKLEVASWQVEQESKQGIYLQMDYGALNSGTILVPAHKVDKTEDGNYTIYIKEKDYFYFLNPDQSQKNRYMMGTTVARQLAKQNGELLVTKNPFISSMRELIKEYNFLVEHGVTSGTQFQELENRFNEKIKETDKELKQLDNRLARLHKIEGALITSEVAPENSFTAIQVLQELNIPTETELTDIQQRIQQYQIEREALQEFFEDTLEHYTNYRDVKEAIHTREIQSRKANEEKVL
ncbi:helical hairpin domain-containing protein [Streptococcus anginosus]|uniref:Relaxase/mobilization nuclease domain-containing protein n=1 Tax=Streptococcus anginosus TaxID=1328 RepID=A0A6G4MWS6_STRAP|nr:relaxase/mobilization nuclease domain-containing protein [Streptococcus anginosus]KAA9254192.1 relaxase/mobilization nuclease domain-containing protein [Streptococcus anginosus]KAA9261165.1 relaxase/mobilization nuclease domain-containing protein [Streptococcus anginosus]KAA9293968.1 relaxase/mobilization nuclease domain-containing protein [Streptococcus anginosus]MCW0933491.1 relaxase/mobilization nuclease domain-containing protein [Streptococcus anginosus]MCW0987509.1 relaxase/mobilizatio